MAKLLWQGNLLLNDKKEIVAGIVKRANGFVVIAYRSHCYIDFDGFETLKSARAFADKAGGMC